MKNEAGLRPMKRGFATRKGNFALRFMATELPLHRSRKALIHIRGANIRLILKKMKIY